MSEQVVEIHIHTDFHIYSVILWISQNHVLTSSNSLQPTGNVCLQFRQMSLNIINTSYTQSFQQHSLHAGDM